MTVVAKCNITEWVLEEVGSMLYGLKCRDIGYPIVENYIEHLGCVDIEICYPSDCINETILFECGFNIVRIQVELGETLIRFFVEEDDYFGGTAPLTYIWEFETDDFTASGAINTSELILALKPGRVLLNLVSKIKVTITDINGCSDTKECWLNKGVMKCSVNFVPCSNPSNLSITNNFVQCAGPIGLIVTQ